MLLCSPKWPQQPGLGKLKPGIRGLVLVSDLDGNGRGPSTLDYFVLQVIMELDYKQSSWDLC